MKAGDMVRFIFNGILTTYGTIINIEEDKAKVDYINPETKCHEVKPILLTELTKIGGDRYTVSKSKI